MTDEIARKTDRICDVLYNKKALDILKIFIGDKSIIADYFVVCSGRNAQQVRALCDELEEKLIPEGLVPKRKEGCQECRWIVVDYGDILVHIFHPEERVYYNLERLWTDGANTEDYSTLRDREAEAMPAHQAAQNPQ